MKVKALAAVAACVSTLALAQMTPTRADGMPGKDDDGFNPVPSVPGVPAPGVTQPPPIKPTHAKPASAKPTPAPMAQPAAPTPEPISPPTPTAQPAPVVAPVATPVPAVTPAPNPAPVTVVEAPKPASPAPAAPAPVAPSGQLTILEVVDMKVAGIPKMPGAIIVSVKGMTKTGGWKNIELKPLQDFAPNDKMRSFTIVGTPPTGFATQAKTEINTSLTIEHLPASVETTRVLSETTEMVQNLQTVR